MENLENEDIFVKGRLDFLAQLKVKNKIIDLIKERYDIETLLVISEKKIKKVEEKK
jgi:hypothetical protein